MLAAIWTFTALGAACAPPGRPYLAELLYDPDGADTGYEFVELLNPLDAPVSLEGLRVETGDGAGAGRWTLRWTGAATDSIRARARFVIGGASVVPAPDAIVTLAAQNGPDAIRLVWPDGATEVLGYGELEFPEYACGAPAEDVPSGFALARVPDDASFGANALDFRAAPPSPGRANQPARDAALEPGALALEPARPAPDAVGTLRARVRNAGRGELAAGAITLHAAIAGLPESAAPLGALGAGETLDATLEIGPLPAGLHVIRVSVRLDEDESPANDADSLTVRVGPGPLLVREIQYHPAAGEGEWIECLNASGAPLALDGFRIGDRSGTLGAPREAALPLAPDSLVVFVQQRAAFLARFPGLDPARVIETAPWPALNNSDDPQGIADEVRVVEPGGTSSDVVAYRAAGIPSGVPIEKRGDAWWPSLAPLGTPLAPPLLPAPIAGSFSLAPRRFAHAALEARIVWDLPWTAGLATLEFYDLAGRRVARAFVDLAVPARGERGVTLAALDPGVYVAAFQVRPRAGGETLVATQALRIEGAAP